MTTSSPILFPLSKCRMPLQTGGVIVRTALVARLGAAIVDARVIVVCAPAGSGKTWSIVQALSARGEDKPAPFWIALDEGDSLPPLVLAQLTATEAADLPWRHSAAALSEMLEDEETGPMRVAAWQRGRRPTQRTRIPKPLSEPPSNFCRARCSTNCPRRCGFF